MSKFKVCVDVCQFKDAPNVPTMKAIGSYIADKKYVVEVNELIPFVKQIGSLGRTFCPSTFKNGTISVDTFEQSQLLTLSFDSFSNPDNQGVTFEKIKARAERYALPILFAYDSYSYWTRKRFNIAFLNETPLYDFREAEAMQRALMMIFPEADKDCSVLKVYRGGNKLLHFAEAMPTINAEWLLMNMCLRLKNRFGPTNYKRKIAEFSQVTGVRLDNRSRPDVSVAEVHTEHHREITDDKNVSKCIIEEGSDEILSHHEYRINFKDGSPTEEVSPDQERSSTTSLRGSDVLKSLTSSCRLYQDFESGSRKLTQQELLGLATNLSQVKSGQKVFKAILGSKAHDAWAKRIDNWDYYFYYVKGKGSRPCTCFCPYRDTCHHGTDILSTVKPKYHQIERIDNWGVPLVEVDEAWNDFNEKFQRAVASDELCWHVIKSQTALGKTQALLEFLRDTPLRVLVSVPTNTLKREECERAKAMGIDIVASPSLHEVKDDIPDVVWDEIQALYDAGKSPMPRLEKAISEDDVECAKLFKEYKRELSEFNNSDGHAITTHRRLTNMDVSKYDLIIVDEDIIYSTVIPNRETVSLSTLKKVRKKLAASDPLAAKIKKVLKKVKDSEFFTLDDEVDWHRAYADIKMAVNIPALCSATHFCYRVASKQENDLTEDSITFIKSVKFPDNKKYIMLSATADETICRLYFNEENVWFYNCKEAAITGELCQYGDRSMGRSSIRKDPSIIEKIKQWTAFNYTISFKEFHKHYEGDLHFGNCAGCDTLKGENIDVIGTPHQPEWIYKLFAYSLGYDVDDSLKPNTVVTHNGFRFRFMTYEDKILRAIQFYMIESELEQAVGRSRLLRCDCSVNLFSDFPLRQAILKESEYDTNESTQLA
ncbi:MAG: hypothetical protein HDT15_12215 [Oscillibacter sp.]|nr:hypothetical protein [Oscillibacter sp.]